MSGEHRRDFRWQSGFDPAVRERFDDGIDERRAAPGERGDRIDLVFVDLNGDANRIEDRPGARQIVRDGARPAGDCCRAATIAVGVFVIARIRRAFDIDSMLRTRTPAAREITSLSSVTGAISRTTARTTAGFTPIRIVSAERATSRLSAVTAMPVSVCTAPRKLIVRFARDDFSRRTEFCAKQPAND